MDKSLQNSTWLRIINLDHIDYSPNMIYVIRNSFIAYHTGYNNKGGYDLFRNNRQFFIFPNPISHEIFFDLLPCHPVLFWTWSMHHHEFILLYASHDRINLNYGRFNMLFSPNTRLLKIFGMNWSTTLGSV